MTELGVIIILCIAMFSLGGFIASYIWMRKFEDNDDRLIEAYISATDAMNDAIENPEHSTEILEGYFKGYGLRGETWSGKQKRR